MKWPVFICVWPCQSAVSSWAVVVSHYLSSLFPQIDLLWYLKEILFSCSCLSKIISCTSRGEAWAEREVPNFLSPELLCLLLAMKLYKVWLAGLWCLMPSSVFTGPSLPSVPVGLTSSVRTLSAAVFCSAQGLGLQGALVLTVWVHISGTSGVLWLLFSPETWSLQDPPLSFACFPQMDHSSVQFSLFPQSCPTLCNLMNRSTSGLPVHHQLPDSTQTHVRRVGDAIQPPHPLSPFFSCPQSFPASGSFPMSQLFTSGGQSIGVSASPSVLPMNIQDWFPLGWTGWISLQSKGLSRVFSNTTAQKHQFFDAQLSSQSNSHIHTWPLEKP